MNRRLQNPLLFLFILLAIFWAEMASAVQCFGVLYASHVPRAKIEVPFIKALSYTHSALLKRGCKSTDIKVLVGDGQARQASMFLGVDLKTKFQSAVLDVGSQFPGSPILPATTQNLETALLDVGKVAKPNDVLYVQVTGHSYSAFEFPSYDDKVITQQFGQWLSSLPSKLKTRVIFDVCFSGSLLDFVDNPGVCTFASTNKKSYAKYSFNNSYSIQMGLALQNPGLSMLQAQLQAERRDNNSIGSVSSLQQLIAESTGLTKIESIMAYLQGEADKKSSLMGQLIDTVYTKSYYAKLLDNTRQDYANPLVTLKSMQSFPAPYLIIKFNLLKSLKTKVYKDWIQIQDIEMALRLQYMGTKASIMSRKKLNQIANCMDEKL